MIVSKTTISYYVHISACSSQTLMDPSTFLQPLYFGQKYSKAVNCSVANKIQHRESLESIFKGLGAIPWALPLWWTMVLVTGALVRRRRRKEKVEALWEEKKKKESQAQQQDLSSGCPLKTSFSFQHTKGAVAPYSTVYIFRGDNCSLETNPLDWLKNLLSQICSKSFLVPESLLPHPILPSLVM